MTKPISIIMGSQSDLATMKSCVEVLGEFKAGYDIRVLSAHRTPAELDAYVRRAAAGGAKVFIAAAGGAAALAGVIASRTTLPVIGVPMESKGLNGLDSLLSTVQMPGGVPVACMAIGSAGAKNAALFALELLAVQDRKIARKLVQYREKMRRTIRSIKLKV